jgi:hypothetical protein
MPIYERSTKELMHDFAKEVLKPGQLFRKQDAVAWFDKKYPKINRMTVRMHVDGMSVNSSSRKHHPNIKPGKGFDLFFKAGPAQYRLWDKDNDPAPAYLSDLQGPDVVVGIPEAQELSEAAEELGASQFAYEADLRDYLARNLGSLERGLKLYQDEDQEFDGVEYQVGGRRIDILARDAADNFVVIELKVSRGHERTIGQLLRYMGWVKANLADGKEVRGMIVARSVDDDLKLAASMIPGIKLVEYELSFRLKPVLD